MEQVVACFRRLLFLWADAMMHRGKTEQPAQCRVERVLSQIQWPVVRGRWPALPVGDIVVVGAVGFAGPVAGARMPSCIR